MHDHFFSSKFDLLSRVGAALGRDTSKRGVAAFLVGNGGADYRALQALSWFYNYGDNVRRLHRGWQVVFDLLKFVWVLAAADICMNGPTQGTLDCLPIGHLWPARHARAQRKLRVPRYDWAFTQTISRSHRALDLTGDHEMQMSSGSRRR